MVAAQWNRIFCMFFHSVLLISPQTRMNITWRNQQVFELSVFFSVDIVSTLVALSKDKKVAIAQDWKSQESW